MFVCSSTRTFFEKSSCNWNGDNLSSPRPLRLKKCLKFFSQKINAAMIGHVTILCWNCSSYRFTRLINTHSSSSKGRQGWVALSQFVTDISYLVKTRFFINQRIKWITRDISALGNNVSNRGNFFLEYEISPRRDACNVPEINLKLWIVKCLFHQNLTGSQCGQFM